MDADRHYCACLSFSESVSVTLPRPDEDGDADETENAITQQSLMFSTKCLVLISRLDYFETFRVRFLNIILYIMLYNKKCSYLFFGEIDCFNLYPTVSFKNWGTCIYKHMFRGFRYKLWISSLFRIQQNETIQPIETIICLWLSVVISFYTL